MFYATRHQVYSGLTHHVVFYWYADLISHTDKHTYTQTHTAHSEDQYTDTFVLTAATFVTLNN